MIYSHIVLKQLIMTRQWNQTSYIRLSAESRRIRAYGIGKAVKGLKMMSRQAAAQAMGSGVRQTHSRSPLQLLMVWCILGLMFFAPVMIPLDRLPGALQITGHILPPTYAARAFRAALQPEITGALLMDVGILALWAIGSLVVVAKTLEWRLD